ncbi:MAG: ribonuclease D [Myxococcota bacterium]
MDAIWIDDPRSLEDYCDSVDDVLAVDTESDHFHAYNARVCLIQLATDEVAALVDPLAMTADELEPFFSLMEDESVVKVFHAGRNDILEIDRDYARRVENLFDTQIAARFLGLDGNSLDFLLEDLVDVDPGKSFQKFDWTTRPLPDDKAEYATADVRHLLEMRDILLARLEQSGWLEPFHQQCEYVATMRHEPNPFDPEGWRGVRGVDSLDAAGRRAISELYTWRHQMCQEVNRAALHAFPDGALLHIARTRPSSKSELDTVRSLPAETFERYADDILEVITRSASVDDPPESRAKKKRSRPSSEVYSRFKRLKKWRNKTWKSLDIPSEFVATNANLMEIAKNPPSTLEELADFDTVLPWHIEMFGQEMLDCM